MPSLTVHHIAHCPEALPPWNFRAGLQGRGDAALDATSRKRIRNCPNRSACNYFIRRNVLAIRPTLRFSACSRLSDSPRAFACLRGALWGDEQTLIGHRGIPLYAAALLCNIAEAAMSTNRCDKDAYANCFCKQVIRARLEQSPEGETSMS